MKENNNVIIKNSTRNSTGKRNAALDFGKFIAALLVVGIHTTPFESLSSELDFFFTHIVCRVAVPFFMVCSGYFFATKVSKTSENTVALLKASEIKWIKMYVSWAIVYLIAVIPNWIETGWMSVHAFLDWGISFVKDGSYYHLWYLVCMIYVFPIFYMLLKKCKPKFLFAIMIILYGIEVLVYGYRDFITISAVQKVFALYDWFGCFTIMFTRCLPFLLCGALISKMKIRLTKTRVGIGLLVSFLGLCAEVYLLKHFEQDQFSYVIFTLPLSFFLFVLIQNCKLPDTSKRIYQKLSNVSMYIYLVHPLAILFLKTYISNSMLFFVIVCFLSIAVSVLLVKIKQRFKRKNA